MKKKTTNDILARLDAMLGETTLPQQKDEFTIAEYMDSMRVNGRRLSESQLFKKLKQMERDGILTCRKGVVGKNRVNLFKFTKP